MKRAPGASTEFVFGGIGAFPVSHFARSATADTSNWGNVVHRNSVAPTKIARLCRGSLCFVRARMRAMHQNEHGLEAMQVVMLLAIAGVCLIAVKSWWTPLSQFFNSLFELLLQP